MPQPPDETSPPTRSYYLTVRLREHERDRLDAMRGAWTLSAYVREALLLALRSGLQGPDEDDFR